ncbi:anti-sigma factor antagonist [Bacillus alveayuensis]|jgi:anti-sigma B factor antagonist|uniref:Anti-sigma factor antagonist n=1 Tax=Aeribacillus alveayuensis TaxID=279215 RepID=A0ABT9VS84_9BACI|nr:anti-sigma factor antagonist [Bacillus alveayuensis]MDQ0163485.1 anti-sigma B factor antagonist [Bacillus alveayuensis]
MDLTIDIKEELQHIEVELSGEIDAYTAPKLRETLMPMAEKDNAYIKISLKEVEYMDSTGLGVFVGLLKAIRKHNGHLKLTDLSPRLERLFNITGLSDIMEIYPKAVGENQ